MSAILEKLNEKQRDAVIKNDAPLAIIAGAGSGKTRTIAHKIAYLLKEKNVLPYRILAVTFTNKAANELKERVISLAGEVGEKVAIYTYHAFCSRFLRSEIDSIGYPKSFNIIDNIDQKSILRPAYKQHSLSPKSISYSSVIDYISTNKNMGKTPNDLINIAEKDIDKAYANLYKFYEEELIRTKSLDFDDLILFTHKILSKEKMIVNKWSERYDFFLIDEFQDTSIKQYEIIKSISQNAQITVVGDPDQTIYTWRNADPSLILNFHQEYRNSEIVKLEENYRSTQEILNAANNLIKNNTNRIEKNLFTRNQNGEKVEYHLAPSEYSEARWVLEKIKELKSNGAKLKDIAIIYRSNYLTNTLEKAFITDSINYVIFGGVKFYQREEIKDAISYLKVINNGDEVAMKRIINKPARKIGQTSQEHLEKFRQESGEENLFDALINKFQNVPLKGLALTELANFIKLIKKYRIAIKQSKPISLVLEKFLIEIGYFGMWSSLEEKSRLDNVNELILSIKDWEKRNPQGSLQDFLNEISLYIDKDDEAFRTDYVSLMTAHTSKGLEFPYVFIFGFSDGIFPSKRSMDEGGNAALEEERRLAYVAVTRAMKKLYISSSKGFAIDYKTEKKPSRFVNELGINIRSFTNTFVAPKSYTENYGENNLVEGDKVIHEKFGEGIVLNISGSIAEIMFKPPHGQKTLMKDHKSIRRKAEM